MAFLTSTDQYILDRAISNLQARSLESLSPQDTLDLTAALVLYISLYKTVFKRSEPYNLTKKDLARFFAIKPYRDLLDIKNFKPPAPEEEPKKKEEEVEKEKEAKDETPPDDEVKKTKTPEKATPQAKEVSTVPAELNELVLAYQESLADKLDADTKHSVADAVLRARKVWDRKNRIETILKNRTEAQKEKDERFFVDKVDPKKGSREDIEFNVRYLAHNAVIAQKAIVEAANRGLGLSKAQIDKAVDDLTYLGISGSVDLTNFRDLEIVTQLVFINQGISITSPVNDVLNVVQAWQHAEEIEPDPKEVDKFKKQVEIADEKAQAQIDISSAKFSLLLEEEIKKNPVEGKTIDLEEAIDRARATTNKIQSSLIRAIPNPVSVTPPSPLQIHEKALEAAIRKADPTLLINPEGLGARTVAVLQGTNSGNKNISPEALRLFALGLSPEKLDTLMSGDSKEAKDLQEYMKNNPDVFQLVHTQLRKVADSKLGKDIEANIKPLSGLSKGVTGFYNSLPSGVQNAAKIALDPAGSVRAWINKKIGARIATEIKGQTGKFISTKLGNYILNEGLQQGVKTFVSDVAKKVGIEVAKKLGITVAGEGLTATLAVALGIPTAGVSLVIAAVVLTIQIGLSFIKKSLNSVWHELFGEEFRWRDLAAPVVAGVAIGTAAVAAATAGFIIVVTATRAAFVSAVGIIIIALVVIGFYAGATFLVAPVLSTLVQLDSIEKVDYFEYATSSSDCGWPTAGHYQVIEGPTGGTHSLSQLQAIDIWDSAIDGTPMLSSTDGVVKSAGPYSNYGNTIVINTTNSAGTFEVYYGHMSMMSVSPGQQVKQGQKIGSVGGSGGWSPHIHFEYKGIDYNQCPAGGVKIPVGCVGFYACGSVYAN